MSPAPLWKLDGVTLAGAARPRLCDVTLEIRAGVTAVVGYSGAGKTSLLNLLTRFERPDRGTLAASLPRDDGRLPLFWVPQDDGLWPHLTAEQHLQVVLPPANSVGNGLRAVPLDLCASDAQGSSRNATEGVPDQNNGEAGSFLSAFDLVEVARALPGRLSQGERSRLAVARGLASGAAVLVMDEPLVHVDPARSGRYWEVVREHCARSGTSLIFATHSPEVVLREAERAICLKEGRVLFEGTVDALYHAPPTEEVAGFLGAANWLPAEEARVWLGDVPRAGACVRPERIAVLPEPGSPFVVEAARFAGSVAEADVRDERTGRRRRFYHRPAGDALRAGAHVVLRLCALLLAAVLCGCDPGAEGPVLDVAEVNTWSMPPDGPSIPAPRAMTVGPERELYVLDNAGRVLVFDAQGEPARQWDMPESSVGNPEGILVLRDGRIAVADTHYHRVVFFDQTGTVLDMWGELGEETGQFIYPVSIAEDDRGNLYVAEYGGNDRIQKFTPEGEFVAAIGSSGTGPGQFQRPSGVVWHEGRLYVADAFNNRVQVFKDSGELVEIPDESDASAGLHYPYGLALAGDSTLLVVEYGAGRVSRVDLNGRVLGRFGTTGAGHGQFSTPWGLAADGDERLFVADTGNRRIVELRW